MSDQSEFDTFTLNQKLIQTARDKSYWAVILGLAPYPDGNSWCVLWGKNLQEGVAAFGRTPVEAIRQFDVEMLNQKAGQEKAPEAHHCVDCCCARSWKALGITEYTGKSIPEEIESLKAELYALRKNL